jgi:gliding motility-associated lipoprotein GldJ
MKIRLLLIVAVISFGLLALVSCRGKQSATTGWNYDDPKNGGFEYGNFVEQQTGPGLILIEGGTYTQGRVEQDVLYDWNNIPRRVTVSTFYMDETEVRNVDYREYLYWLRRVYADYPDIYKNALPDTLCWRRTLAYNEPYVENYFRHPAYREYPVVGISWIKANAYCKWRTDRVNEDILIRYGILFMNPNQTADDHFDTEAYLAGQYEGEVKQDLNDLDPNRDTRKVRMEDGIFLPEYRLPTEAEWEYAALALIGNSVNERIYERKLYPWNGHYVRRNPNQSETGMWNANNWRGRGDAMGVAGYLNDNGDITTPVDSYWPNDYGLYCMAGNVNEWVMDVYRPLSYEISEEFRPFRGNVFRTKDLDEEGLIAEKDSLGNIKWHDVSDQDCLDKTNYRRADNRNFLDGDYQSSLQENTGNYNDETRASTWKTDNMYRTPNAQRDMKARTFISDRARVYKGGSWADRTYWMVPGTRRFLEETRAQSDLGFRCAMTRVGSPVGFK